MTFVSAWVDLFKRRAWKPKTPEAQLKRSVGENELKRCLGPFDLIMLGIGGIIGSGVFVLTGVAAREHAGPAVVISYSVAAAAALLSGLCYTEFTVDLPTAGGAFNYVAVVFGEFTAWLVACNLVMEYTLSCAAIARGFSAYLATLAGQRPTFFTVHASFLHMDFFALGLIIVLSCILAYGTKESARFNTTVTMVNLAVIVYVVCAGMPYAAGTNYRPFAPFGAHGVFAAASIVFFSFIGFDTVATTAEEVKNPAVDLPIGIVGSLLVCAFLYALMCVVICLMVPYGMIDINAPFSEAFHHILTTTNNITTAKKVFLQFSERIVSIGAVTGIVTSLLVALLGQARIYVVLGREWLLPSWFAYVHPKRETPIYAAAWTGLTAGVLALLVDINALAQLVSIGTLFVFYMVDLGILVRRYYTPGSGDWKPLTTRCAAMLLFNLGFTVAFRLHAPIPVYVVLAVMWLGAATTLYTLPVVWRPAKFAVPLSPLTPALGMFITLHLIGSLGWQAYARFGGWVLLSMAAYVLYGMHRAEAKDARDSHTLVSHAQPPANGAGSGTVATAADGAEVELMNRPSHQPAGDAWRDDSSDSDESYRGTSTLLKGSDGRTLSDHPQYLQPDDPLERVPGAPPDLPAEAVPGSTAGWAAVHNGSVPQPGEFDDVDLNGSAAQLARPASLPKQ
mmetsp:Transcript_15504/g.46826  ORF Transcript_15504/g.46826 Transcript_15504/m.46826 type:complete len:678 (+) Transcript_15504:234-2267(+)